MQLTSRQVVMQFAHMLQEELFPLLQSSVGPLNGQMQLLASVISLAPLERMQQKQKKKAKQRDQWMRMEKTD
jgi:hypothetical protein